MCVGENLPEGATLLKAGPGFADMLSTASPQNGYEIEVPASRRGLAGKLRAGSHEGNGVGERLLAVVRFEAATLPMSHKISCKLPPRRRALLPERLAAAVLAHIDWYDPQKGCDLTVELADDLLRSDVPTPALETGRLRDRERLEQQEEQRPGTSRVLRQSAHRRKHPDVACAIVGLVSSFPLPGGSNPQTRPISGMLPAPLVTGTPTGILVDVPPREPADGMVTGWSAVNRLSKVVAPDSIGPVL
jgi:hypothetical protein